MNVRARLDKLASRVTEKYTGYCKCDLSKEFRILKTREEVAAADNEPPLQCGQCGREIERITATFNIAKATEN